MATPKKETQRDYLKTLDLLAKRIAQIFRDTFKRVLSKVSVNKIANAVIANDADRILLELDITPATFSQFVEELRQANIAGGIAAQVTIRTDFNAADPATVARLSTQSSSLVTEIIESQREAVQTALAGGFGRNPRSVALDIVGRVSKVTGRREGGVVGLTGQQSGYVVNARAELETLDYRYFTRTLRDRRFDATVRKAIDSKTRLPKDVINKIIGRYSDRMLKNRGDTIGRTETLRALAYGRHAAMEQAIASGKISEQNVTKIWATAEDSAVRDSHAFMDKERVAMSVPFLSGMGNALMYPGDPSAPAADVIDCRCFVAYDVDYLAQELG